MTHKLSDWQSGNTIPAHEGVYQRKNQFGAFYALFKNGKWKFGWTTQEAAESEKIVSSFQECMWKWRGIK